MLSVKYEIETRWKERGRLLAWGYAAEEKTYENARARRLSFIRRHTGGPIVSGYEVRIVKVTTEVTRQEMWLESVPNLWMGEPMTPRQEMLEARHA